MEELNVKSRLLTGYLEYLIRSHFSKDSGSDPYIDIFTPSDPSQRGCQLSLCFSINVSTIFSYLTKHGIVVSLFWQVNHRWTIDVNLVLIV